MKDQKPRLTIEAVMASAANGQSQECPELMLHRLKARIVGRVEPVSKKDHKGAKILPFAKLNR